MKKAIKIAEAKLETAKLNWEFKNEEDEVNRLSQLLDDDKLYNSSNIS
jgi:hypothetical protein